MTFPIRRRWVWIILGVALAGVLLVVLSPDSAYNRIQLGMTEDQVIELLGRSSQAYTYYMVTMLPDGSQVLRVQEGKDWNRAYGTIQLLFESGRVVKKSEVSLMERAQGYALRMLRGPTPPPIPAMPSPPTAPYNEPPAVSIDKARPVGQMKL
jgi:hypothetical protein